MLEFLVPCINPKVYCASGDTVIVMITVVVIHHFGVFPSVDRYGGSTPFTKLGVVSPCLDR